MCKYFITLIKPTDPKSKILATDFIDGIQIPYIKNKLRMQDPDNLSALYGFAIKEDQKQKIRELDFGSSSSKASAHVMSMQLKAVDVTNVAVMTISARTALLIEIMTKDINLTHGQQKHYNDYRSKSNDENSIEKSIQAVTDLLKSLLKQNKPSHTTFNKSKHRHLYTSNHSDHKPSYNHPNHRSDKSDNRGHHNKGKYRNNTQVNEIGTMLVTIIQAVLTNQMKGRYLIRKSFPSKN